jgi:hypothetical protein
VYAQADAITAVGGGDCGQRSGTGSAAGAAGLPRTAPLRL